MKWFCLLLSGFFKKKSLFKTKSNHLVSYKGNLTKTQ